ncbi:Transmembrane protein [Trichinella pseudospiralis]
MSHDGCHFFNDTGPATLFHLCFPFAFYVLAPAAANWQPGWAERGTFVAAALVTLSIRSLSLSYSAEQYLPAKLKLMIGLEFLNKECELRQDEIKIRILQMCQFCLGMLLINTSHLAVGFSASARCHGK